MFDHYYGQLWPFSPTLIRAPVNNREAQWTTAIAFFTVSIADIVCY